MTKNFERVVDIVSQIFGVQISQVNPETDLLRDLGADELDRRELRYELEEEFGIRIPDSDAELMRTVEEAMALVQELAAN